MIKDIYSKKRLASSWFNLLQQTICYEFENIEHDLGKKIGQKPKYFEKKLGENLG
jgi:coproporphyrinogen III oxidase